MLIGAHVRADTDPLGTAADPGSGRDRHATPAEGRAADLAHLRRHLAAA